MELRASSVEVRHYAIKSTQSSPRRSNAISRVSISISRSRRPHTPKTRQPTSASSEESSETIEQDCVLQRSAYPSALLNHERYPPRIDSLVLAKVTAAKLERQQARYLKKTRRRTSNLRDHWLEKTTPSTVDRSRSPLRLSQSEYRLPANDYPITSGRISSGYASDNISTDVRSALGCTRRDPVLIENRESKTNDQGDRTPLSARNFSLPLLYTRKTQQPPAEVHSSTASQRLTNPSLDKFSIPSHAFEKDTAGCSSNLPLAVSYFGQSEKISDGEGRLGEGLASHAIRDRNSAKFDLSSARYELRDVASLSHLVNALPSSLKVRSWKPSRSSSAKNFQSRDSYSDPFKAASHSHKTANTGHYVLTQIYELPEQLSHLWGDNIVNGRRFEQPPLDPADKGVELDLYGWVTSSGTNSRWVDSKILVNFLIEPAKYPEIRDQQADQFHNVQKLFFNNSTLEKLVKTHHNADFLTLFPCLRSLIINLHGSHFGPSPGLNSMMGFKRVSKSSSLTLEVQKTALSLLSGTLLRNPQWLVPSLVLAEVNKEDLPKAKDQCSDETTSIQCHVTDRPAKDPHRFFSPNSIPWYKENGEAVTDRNLRRLSAMPRLEGNNNSQNGLAAAKESSSSLRARNLSLPPNEVLNQVTAARPNFDAGLEMPFERKEINREQSTSEQPESTIGLQNRLKQFPGKIAQQNLACNHHGESDDSIPSPGFSPQSDSRPGRLNIAGRFRRSRPGIAQRIRSTPTPTSSAEAPVRCTTLSFKSLKTGLKKASSKSRSFIGSKLKKSTDARSKSQRGFRTYRHLSTSEVEDQAAYAQGYVTDTSDSGSIISNDSDIKTRPRRKVDLLSRIFGGRRWMPRTATQSSSFQVLRVGQTSFPEDDKVEVKPRHAWSLRLSGAERKMPRSATAPAIC